jgi:spore coat polysaccharide biosynthesis predicted glycosyltransferase SpsG
MRRMLSVVRCLATTATITLLTRTPDAVARDAQRLGLTVLSAPAAMTPTPPPDDESMWLTYMLAYAAEPPDVLIVDHPHAYEAETLRRLRHTTRVVRVDARDAGPDTYDLCVQPHAHLAVAEDDRVLSGWTHVLLSEAVYQRLPAPDLIPAYAARPDCLTFVAGGSDPHGMLPRMYELSRPLDTYAPSLARLYAVGEHAVWPPTRHLSPNAMVAGFTPWVLLAPLVVSAWGVTVYECLAMGTPVVTVARTPSQQDDAARLAAQTEACVDGSAACAAGPEAFAVLLESLWLDRGRRTAMHEATKGLIDTGGPARVAARILALKETA